MSFIKCFVDCFALIFCIQRNPILKRAREKRQQSQEKVIATKVAPDISAVPAVSLPIYEETHRRGPPSINVRTATLPSDGTFEATLSSSPLSLMPSHSIRRNDSDASSPRARSLPGEESLKTLLRNSRVNCHRRAHHFIVPRCRQGILINVPSVARDIRAGAPEMSEEAAADVAEQACQSARQLYATLAYIKKGPSIRELLEEGVSDQDLPLVSRKHGDRKYALHRRVGMSLKIISSLAGWTDKQLEKFDRVQWWMRVRVFQEGAHYELDEEELLPFIHFTDPDKEPKIKQGGYSEVYCKRVHPSHHEFWKDKFESSDDEPLVAVKQLYSPDEKEFLKEQTILQRLGSKNHPHLIKLLATYKQKNKYHLMFQYADANLRTYWEDRPLPEFDEETVLWSMQQMTGIANALMIIHNFRVTHPLTPSGTGGHGKFRMPNDVVLSVEADEPIWGRHGDIKPENILWFQNPLDTPWKLGVLQIADFGLGRFHGRDSRSKVNPETVAASPTYEPPECKLRRPVSRAYDLWSLGCLYLEFITWLLEGSAEIDGFSEFRGQDASTGINDDNFFTIIRDIHATSAVVRKEVVLWVYRLHAHPRCSELIHNLLDFTMQEMLIIDSKKRCNAKALDQQMKIYLRKAHEDKDYLLKPVPRQPRTSAERSNSTPASAQFNAYRSKLVNFAGQEEVPSFFRTSSGQGSTPKDLVLRHLNTPGCAPETHRTWPLTSRVND